MVVLLSGLILFFAIHLVPSFVSLRDGLVARLGLGLYKAVFALLSVAGLGLIVYGKAQAEFVALWHPPHELSVVTKLLMLPAMVFLVAAYVPNNFRKKIKHPMLTAVKTWALAHLLANGDLASVLLFGSFLAYGVVAVISANRRGKVKPVTAEPLWKDVLVVVLGGVLYAGIGMHHYQLFGVPIM